MSTISLELTKQSRSGLQWRGVKRQLTDWWHAARSRAELEGLDDKCLQDIGVTRCTADFEAAKPFWIA